MVQEALLFSNHDNPKIMGPRACSAAASMHYKWALSLGLHATLHASTPVLYLTVCTATGGHEVVQEVLLLLSVHGSPKFKKFGTPEATAEAERAPFMRILDRLIQPMSLARELQLSTYTKQHMDVSEVRKLVALCEAKLDAARLMDAAASMEHAQGHPAGEGSSSCLCYRHQLPHSVALSVRRS